MLLLLLSRLHVPDMDGAQRGERVCLGGDVLSIPGAPGHLPAGGHGQDEDGHTQLKGWQLVWISTNLARHAGWW